MNKWRLAIKKCRGITNGLVTIAFLHPQHNAIVEQLPKPLSLMPMKCTNNSQRTDLEDCKKQTLPNTWHAFYSFSGKAMEFLFGHFSIPMIREEVRASIQFHPTSTSIPCFLENALEVFRVLGDQLVHCGPQNQLVQMNILTPEPNTKI